MSLHVDLVRNDWRAETQNIMARVYADDGDLTVKPENSERDWDLVVRQALAQRDRRPDEARLAELSETLDESPYLFATQPHSDDRCPFAVTGFVRMKRRKLGGEFRLRRP